MTQFLVNLPEMHKSGVEVEKEIFAVLKKLGKMEKEALAVIADPQKYIKDGNFYKIIEAFAQLSGYINGTDPEWAVLKGKLNNAETKKLDGALKSVLQHYNDVKIPVGTNDHGKTIYARVYEDGNYSKPATAWDFVKEWIDTPSVTDHTFKTGQFFFKYSDKHIHNGNTPWSGGIGSDFHGGSCGRSTHYFNPTKEPGGGIRVHEDHAGSCSQSKTYEAHGDAQALAGYCTYSNDKNPNYNGSAVFDKFLDQTGLGFNL